MEGHRGGESMNKIPRQLIKGKSVRITEGQLRRLIREELTSDSPPEQMLVVLNRRFLPAPNRWGDKDLIHLRVDLGPLEAMPSATIPGFVERLVTALPTLDEHRCSYGEPGGFIRRMTEDEGTWMGHILEHVALELQCLQGHDVSFGRTRGAGAEGIYDIWIECRDPRVGMDAALAAREMLLQIIDESDS